LNNKNNNINNESDNNLTNPNEVITITNNSIKESSPNKSKIIKNNNYDKVNNEEPKK
jgi:hypothetical protein